jgi:hypothetical protein
MYVMVWKLARYPAPSAPMGQSRASQMAKRPVRNQE